MRGRLTGPLGRSRDRRPQGITGAGLSGGSGRCGGRARYPRRGRAPAPQRRPARVSGPAAPSPAGGVALLRAGGRQGRGGPQLRTGGDNGSRRAAIPPLPPQPPHRRPRALPLPVSSLWCPGGHSTCWRRRLYGTASHPPPTAPPALAGGGGGAGAGARGAVHAGRRSARPPLAARASPARRRACGLHFPGPRGRPGGGDASRCDWPLLRGGGARARGSSCPVATEGKRGAAGAGRAGPAGGRRGRSGLGRAV